MAFTSRPSAFDVWKVWNKSLCGTRYSWSTWTLNHVSTYNHPATDKVPWSCKHYFLLWNSYVCYTQDAHVHPVHIVIYPSFRLENRQLSIRNFPPNCWQSSVFPTSCFRVLWLRLRRLQRGRYTSMEGRVGHLPKRSFQELHNSLTTPKRQLILVWM